MLVARPLVIVESPAKARTIAGFLGGDFTVRASMGHVRDLPSKGLSVDTENGFKVDYEVHASKKNVIKELRDALKGADELYLATDEDREGEAISWHLLEVLKPKVPVKRMVFHEITQHAIDDAIANWRERMAFVAASYWDLDAAFPTDPQFSAGLVAVSEHKVAEGKDFDSFGQLKRADEVVVLDEDTARGLAERLDGATFTVRSVDTKP